MKDDMGQEVSGEMVPDVVRSGANPVTQRGDKLRLSEASAAHSYIHSCAKTPQHSPN